MIEIGPNLMAAVVTVAITGVIGFIFWLMLKSTGGGD